ncbi:adenylate/guanylate cyclase domain-containing protein [Muriicola sp. Z0-33]|uniref:adenylate/guanylate cyclase domain-containing protein n=1 Tax=Muriicola sp. Z0-33 TaxID=2816957 RepID=UPI002237ADB2|nr:adenylate/guanylate cyclase domain-containing protein [Muriicola sp. Z0-33]MCW5515785.1 adenylate/guanylate cyclase domain-containing protein [Muriicola sp. Z0-33]
MLHPRYKRYIKQILPIPIIWFLAALIYSLLEYGLLGSLDYYPSTQNPYNFSNNLKLTLIACIIFGLLQGAIEILWLRKRFIKMKLWVKITFKTFFYLSFVIIFLIVISTFNSFINFSGGDWSKALADLNRFITNFAFWSVILYIGATLYMALFISEISQHLGDGVLLNFLLGKYHRPKEETRIFMFLDMKSSTTIAENLGHERYFVLLRAYYADMTSAILETLGQIYQYVGDEIVISWPLDEGVYQNNCIRCFSKIQEAIAKRSAYYMEHFGHIPQFKAGYHIGEVTTGEIGIIKKEIIYTGDVLNTTARIQSECNAHNAMALISGKLLRELQKEDPISFEKIGEMTLRGKTEAIELYSVVF